MAISPTSPRNDAWFVIGAFSKDEHGLWNRNPDRYYIGGALFSDWPQSLDDAHRMTYNECWVVIEKLRPIYEPCGWKLTGYIAPPVRRKANQ